MTVSGAFDRVDNVVEARRGGRLDEVVDFS